MKKRMILALMLIGLLAFGAGLGTYAWFTSQATSTDNVFQTGTLKIENPGDGIFASGILEVDNIYPSWTGSKDIIITNSGSLDFIFRLNNITLKASTDNAGMLFNGEHGLEISFDGEEWFKAKEVLNYEFGEITTEEGTEKITVHYRLPEEAGNNYQGIAATLEFNFFATQVNNTDWEE